MKRFSIILTLLLFWTICYSQIEKGRYQICLDYCYFDPCHGQYIIDFMDNDSCKIGWFDDVSHEISRGLYHINDSTITFEPIIKNDSIQMIYRYDMIGSDANKLEMGIKSNENTNIVWLRGLSDEFLGNIELTLFKGNTKVDTCITDTLGYAKYSGEIADSILFKVQTKEFTIIPNKHNKPSWIKIHIDFHYQDLCDRIHQLNLKDNSYWLDFKCDDNKIKKRQMTRMK